MIGRAGPLGMEGFMPTSLHDREKAFEAQYAHEEEVRFLVTARRDKLFAKWAAAKIAVFEVTEDDLTEGVLAIAGGAGHDQAVLNFVAGAFLACGQRPADSELAAALEHCGQQAREASMPPSGSGGAV